MDFNLNGNQTGPKYARGYCRVSTVMQEADGVSLETQHARITQHCQYKNFNLVNFYEDRGISGKNMNRPGLKSLFADIQDGDYVIISDLSRLSRNPRDALEMLQQFDDKGVYLVCLQPDMDFSTPIGRMIFTVLMAVHQLERENIAKHVSNNMQRLSAEGKLRARPPFGWKFVGKNKDYEPEPQQQKVIEKIKELYLRGGPEGRGMKYAQIARKLNEDGDNLTLSLNKRPSNRKTPPKFHPEQIKRILIDCELVNPVEKDVRIPIAKRIVSHRKNLADDDQAQNQNQSQNQGQAQNQNQVKNQGQNQGQNQVQNQDQNQPQNQNQTQNHNQTQPQNQNQAQPQNQNQSQPQNQNQNQPQDQGTNMDPNYGMTQGASQMMYPNMNQPQMGAPQTGQMNPNQMYMNQGQMFMNPNQMYYNQMNYGQMDYNQMNPTVSPIQSPNPESQPPSSGLPQSHGQTNPNQMYPNQMYPNQMYPNQMYPNQMYPNQMYQMNPAQMNPNQMNQMNQMNSAQTNPNQMNPDQMNGVQSPNPGLTQPPSNIPLQDQLPAQTSDVTQEPESQPPVTSQSPEATHNPTPS